jgi:uncharacterized PurR-regulated membrane protein YhhQ (DUF165 family)|tara:strand:- start:71 stop:553 length:483 start_codon:yes stop_codon:yes gene_type:complete
MGLQKMKFKYAVIYIATVVAINMAFAYIPPIVLFDGTIFTIGSVVAGLVFVARDFAQREVGHKVVLLLMAAAGLLSYLLADPFVAIASITAFAISELSDYIVYSKYKGDFNKRVVVSSLVSVPIDTAVFLAIISHLSALSFAVMCVSKLLVVAYFVKFKK